jgi:nitroimidazol reductase NimA-like FMN-containing flavoprotein (pyridoxamine 5'-phosphate oxidase superfamily)
MRRADRACDDDWIRAFLSDAQVGYFATAWDEQPFISPNLFWYDPQRHEIYFHTANVGRKKANIERNARVSFCASRSGALLPSNVALEFTIQYESVVAFGQARFLEDEEEKRRVLYGLIAKYYPGMQPGEHYRPIQDAELHRTAVYAIAIQSWSGKRNWQERAVQSADWPALVEG